MSLTNVVIKNGAFFYEVCQRQTQQLLEEPAQGAFVESSFIFCSTYQLHHVAPRCSRPHLNDQFCSTSSAWVPCFLSLHDIILFSETIAMLFLGDLNSKLCPCGPELYCGAQQDCTAAQNVAMGTGKIC